MGRGRAVRVVALTIGVFQLGLGAWAFFAPASFFGRLAAFEPYNEHFIRDIGAFQIGLGAVLLFALVWIDALLVALAGVATGFVFHFFSHLIDRAAGGRVTDVPTFGLLALVLVLAAAWRAQDVGIWPRKGPGDP